MKKEKLILIDASKNRSKLVFGTLVTKSTISFVLKYFGTLSFFIDCTCYRLYHNPNIFITMANG